MYLLLPYHVDVPMRRVPWMNWVIIGLTFVFFLLTWRHDDLTPLGEKLVLHGGSWLGWPGHVLVHAGFWHLAGNLLFLWVFGNAVCAKVGNIAFPAVYFGLGLFSAIVSSLFDNSPSVGASGAINGIVGMFLVWYLLNETSCFFAYWFFGMGDAGSQSIGSYWLILVWFCYDIFGLFYRGEDNTDFGAHVAGFVGGVILAIVLTKTGLVEIDEGERNLLDIMAGKEAVPRRRKKKKNARLPQITGEEFKPKKKKRLPSSEI